MVDVEQIGRFTVELSVLDASESQLGDLAKGVVFGLCREYDPVKFEVNLDPGDKMPEVRVDVPSVLTGSRIDMVLDAARVAKDSADQIAQKYLAIYDGDFVLVAKSMIKDRRWKDLSQFLAIAWHLDGPVSKDSAATIIECLLLVLERSELGSHHALRNAIGSSAMIQCAKLAMILEPELYDWASGLDQYVGVCQRRYADKEPYSRFLK